MNKAKSAEEKEEGDLMITLIFVELLVDRDVLSSVDFLEGIQEILEAVKKGKMRSEKVNLFKRKGVAQSHSCRHEVNKRQFQLSSVEHFCSFVPSSFSCYRSQGVPFVIVKCKLFWVP